eukprot:TRINITY_DN3055_c0_g1_i2.p3 TRINITY_DN3055_c0_g1~~TRINITY_DN3055_c0_g1_i2.p3  ORF type:complete len:732 (+),score=360.21 TRINITY_DN3055_c0_g1_i2:52-2247(+)
MAMAGAAAGGGGGTLAPVTIDVVLERTAAKQPLGLRVGPGCEVKQVAPGSAAAAAGVFAGTRVTMVNGEAVGSCEAAKEAEGGAKIVRMRMEYDGSAWLRGRVAGWREDKGFGYITPDVPMVLPEGALHGNEHPSVYIGDVCFKAAVVAGAAPRVGEAVLFRGRCVDSVPCAGKVVVDADAAAAKAGPVEFHNEMGKITFAPALAAGAVCFSKAGGAFVSVTRLSFDGDCTVCMPEHGFWCKVRLPVTQRAPLLRQLKALAEAAGVKHNFPEAPEPPRTAAPALSLCPHERAGGEAMACRGRVDAAMMAATTRHLWVGWLDPLLGKDEARLRASVTEFLRGHDVAMVKAERNAARVGAFVELRAPITQLQVAALNVRPYRDTHGAAHRITVDDAQPRNPFLALKRCPRLTGPGRFCRGCNLQGHHDWTDACSFRHDARDFPTHGAELEYEDVAEGGAKWDELAVQVEEAGLGVVTRIRRVVNAAQEAAYESRRAFSTAMHGSVSEKELWHGTDCSVLDTLLTRGMQCPADSRACDECPVSGGKGLCTTLCGTDCARCVEPHVWGECHMFGMGLYMADQPQKSHRYVRPHNGVHQLVKCRVNLGSPYMIEANLRTPDAMHNLVRCSDPKDMIEANQHAWDTMKGHESFYVKGLGAKAKHGLGVVNNEYVVFHPAQVLPLYVVDYDPKAKAAGAPSPDERAVMDILCVPFATAAAKLKQHRSVEKVVNAHFGW